MTFYRRIFPAQELNLRLLHLLTAGGFFTTESRGKLLSQGHTVTEDDACARRQNLKNNNRTHNSVIIL